MNTNELKAVLEVTDEVAIYPVHIEAEPPAFIGQRHRGVLYCPSNLTRAKVLATRHPWVERRPVSQCGDTDYDVPHRNGVLVEIALAADDSFVIYRGKVHRRSGRKRADLPYRHTTAVKRDGTKYVHMVVKPRVILSSWAEYALVEEQRRREEQEQREKRDRLLAAQSSLMGGMSPAQLAKRSLMANYLTEYEYTSNGSYARDANGERIVKAEHGRLDISIEQAEKILAMLTPRQKAKLVGDARS